MRPLADRRVQTARAGAASLRFCGYGRRRIQALLDGFDIVPDRDPPLLELSEVLFAPGQRCLYDADGVRIEASKVLFVEPDAPAWSNPKMGRIEQETMPARIQPPPRANRVREPVLFLGEVHDHYGHFLTDTLARMWALERFDPAGQVLFAPDPKLRLDPPLVQLMLQQLGLGEHRILRPAKPTVFERLLLPVAALQMSRVYQALERPHRIIAERLIGAQAPPDRPVYLSRSRLGPALRRPRGEERLEQLLAREGYLIVHPERLGLPSQIALFNGERPIVGAYGSAMHSLLFRLRPEGQRLAVLMPEQIGLWARYPMVDAVKGSEAAYVLAMKPPEGPRLSGEDWRIDIDAAMAALHDAGFFSHERASP